MGVPAIRALQASPYTWGLTTVPGPCDLAEDGRWLLPRITGGSIGALRRAVLRAPVARISTRRTLRTWAQTLVT